MERRLGAAIRRLECSLASGEYGDALLASKKVRNGELANRTFMRLPRAAIACSLLILCSTGIGSAESSGPATIQAMYAKYLKQGFSQKSVPRFKPYFEARLYALAVHWAGIKQTSAMREDCTFDADPFAATQNGTPSEPVTVGAGKLAHGAIAYPVGVTLKFSRGHLTSHVIVDVVRTMGDYRVSDIIPMVDGKAYPDASLRANLTAFATRSVCK